MFLWCQQQDEDCVAWVQNELTKNGLEKYSRFQSPVAFTRWLFSQKRGAIQPWSVLLAHWRDAKPCSSAVATTRSGCLKHLAHLPADAQRPNLPVLTVSKEHMEASTLQPVNSAVSAMIIIVSKGKQEGRARLWVSNMQAAAKKALTGNAHNPQTCSEHWWADGFHFFIASDAQSLTASLCQCQPLIEVSPPEDFGSSNDHFWPQLVHHKRAWKSHGTFVPDLTKKRTPYKKRVVSHDQSDDAEKQRPIAIRNIDINNRTSELSEPWLLSTKQLPLGMPDNFLPNEPAMISLCPDPEIIPGPVFSVIWHL